MICKVCGDGLSIEEMDWNDGLCDTCQGILEDGHDPFDPPSDDDDDGDYDSQELDHEARIR